VSEDRAFSLPGGRRLLPVQRRFERLVLRVCGLALRGLASGGMRLMLPSGQSATFNGTETGIRAEIVVHNSGLFWKSLRRGGIGFAESYINGDWSTPDLGAIFRFFLENRRKLDRKGEGWFRVRLADRLYHLSRRNSRSGSRRNIADHYDIGNDFYRLWLDETMTYSSALYSEAGQSLASAQKAKQDRILELLDIKPGGTLLDMGCGWGGLALGAAQDSRARVTGLTLSQAQQEFAIARAQAMGVEDLCSFQLQEYRDEVGLYDRAASIEMIEAIGEDQWPSFFRVLHDRLKPGGVAVIQAITISERSFGRYQRRPDFIQRYVFPGGMLPTRRRIEEGARAAGFDIGIEDRLGASYALTLNQWRQRFEENWPRIEALALGFDARFKRLWTYYLTYCEVGFEQGVVDAGIYRLIKSS
jgi:cyclopropane-fatty-acyl-phospholipid synthase